MIVYIMPEDNRTEALEAYDDWLNAEQRQQIREADDDATIKIEAVYKTTGGFDSLVTITVGGVVQFKD